MEWETKVDMEAHRTLNEMFLQFLFPIKLNQWNNPMKNIVKLI